MSNFNALQQAAEDYARRGWPVFPLTPGKKTPITEHGQKDASTDIQKIRNWWKQWPAANVGIVCRPAGLYAVDLDRKDGKDGPAQWARLAEQHGFLPNGTLTNITPTGGRHLVYAAPTNTPLPNTSGTLAPGIDTRGPGYIVAPPSVVAGKAYHWENEAAEVLPLPAPVARLVMASQPASQPASDTTDFIPMLQPSRVAALPPVAPDWLVHKFIERGSLIMLTAPGGSMKSLAMLDMAVCLSTGRPWLNELKTKACPVLWVNTDNSEATHNARLGAVLRAHGLEEAPVHTLTIFDLDVSNPAHIRAIEDAANHVKAGLLAVDTLSGALPGVDENAAKEMTGPAAHLRALAGEGRTVLVIHHPPKGDPNGARGSSVLTSKVDCFFSLARKDDLITITAQKARNAPPVEIVALPKMEFTRLSPGDEEEALYAVRFVNGRLTQQAKEQDEYAEVDKKIMAVLAIAPKSQNQIRTETALSFLLLKARLAALVDGGQVAQSFGQRNAILYSTIF